MSKMQKRTIKCRQCGKEFEVTIYDSINTELNPELVEKVHDASIFDVECPHCHATRFLNYPCLYHDQKNNFMVQLNSYPDLLRFKKDISQIDDDNPVKTLMKKTMSGYTIVGSTSFPEWLTTIVLLENKLDWRAGKIAINQQLERAAKKESNGIKSIDYYFLDGTKNNEGELILRVGINGEREAHPTFHRAMYDWVLDNCKENIKLYNPFIFEEEEVKDFMKKPMNEYKYAKLKDENVFIVRTAEDDLLFCSSISKFNKRIKLEELVRVDLVNNHSLTGFVVDILNTETTLLALDKRVDGTIVERIEW